MKKIKELFKGINHQLINADPESAVSGISADSRLIKKGEIFLAIKGPQYNGCDYIKDALQKGAPLVCLDDPEAVPESRGAILVKDASRTFSLLASRIFGDPSRDMKVIGVTGTNGKTTVSYLIYEILKLAGRSPSLIGTVQYKINSLPRASSNTTPGPMLLHSLFRRMRRAGSDYMVMEVSSHALKQNRVFGINFKTAVLTNITGDHMDYHKTMKNYVAAKRILFGSLTGKAAAVLNKDDAYYAYLRKAVRTKAVSYGIESKADFTATEIKSDVNGSSFTILLPKGKVRVNTRLIGRHNIYNILAAVSACFIEGISPEIIRRSAECFRPVPGRLESVGSAQPFRIFIDYAHTHDALEKVLRELRTLCEGKLVVVFGCGGDRDRIKRPKMGKIASEIADEIILTSDNPRSEDPEAILDEIELGIVKNFGDYRRIASRFGAIEESLRNRKKGDIVLIAGKGHEDYQIIGAKMLPFSDKAVVEKILNKRRQECLR